MEGLTGRKAEQAQEGKVVKGAKTRGNLHALLKGQNYGKWVKGGKTCGNLHALLKEQRDGK